MSLSSFLIRVILLVVPGIVGSLLYRSFIRSKASRKDWEDYVEILLFSFFSYGIYGLLLYALSRYIPDKLYKIEDPLAAFRAFTSETAPIDKPVGHAILFTVLIAVPVAWLASYIDELKLFYKIAPGNTGLNRFWEDDVWEYFNRKYPDKWVYVKDHKYDLYYIGVIKAYSDPRQERELLLKNVDVYRASTAEHLYKSDVIYLSRKSDDLTIEVYLESNKETGNQQDDLKNSAAYKRPRRVSKASRSRHLRRGRKLKNRRQRSHLGAAHEPQVKAEADPIT
jgi:hypothetical protein